MAYCYQCGGFPCRQYEHIDDYDSFITHQGRMADLALAKELGPAAYAAIQREKVGLLKKLLDGYDDGRHKSFFCMAVNLLELEELTAVHKALEACPGQRTDKERTAYAVELLEALAKKKDITLKLRKRPRQK